jgi:hypothetical protein
VRARREFDNRVEHWRCILKADKASLRASSICFGNWFLSCDVLQICTHGRAVGNIAIQWFDGESPETIQGGSALENDDDDLASLARDISERRPTALL